MKAGARMRIGAPVENARMAPATPTPMPISALPEMIGCSVSPAPAVPKVSSTRPLLLEDAGVLAERRRLVLPIVDLADRDLEGVVGTQRQRRQGRRGQRQRQADDVGSVHLRFLPFGVCGLCDFPGFAAGFFLAGAALDVAFTARGAAGISPRLASRVAQYSHAREWVFGRS